MEWLWLLSIVRGGCWGLDGGAMVFESVLSQWCWVNVETMLSRCCVGVESVLSRCCVGAASRRCWVASRRVGIVSVLSRCCVGVGSVLSRCCVGAASRRCWVRCCVGAASMLCRCCVGAASVLCRCWVGVATAILCTALAVVLLVGRSSAPLHVGPPFRGDRVDRSGCLCFFWFFWDRSGNFWLVVGIWRPANLTNSDPTLSASCIYWAVYSSMIFCTMLPIAPLIILLRIAGRHYYLPPYMMALSRSFKYQLVHYKSVLFERPLYSPIGGYTHVKIWDACSIS